MKVLVLTGPESSGKSWLSAEIQHRFGGLLVGDVIEAVDGRPIHGVDAADRAFLGQTLDIRVRRGKRDLDVHLDAGGGDGRGEQGPVDRG